MLELAPEPESYDKHDESYYEPCDYCGGKVVATGGEHYYNGSYNCYILYLRCENCGDYEVECV